MSVEETILKEKLDTLKIHLHKDEDSAKDVKLSRWRRTLKLSPLLLLYFIVSFCLAFTGPFTSSLTAEKRLEKWQIAVIFGSSKVTIFLGTILVVAVMKYLKPHWLMVVSLIGVSISLAITGCLSWIPEGSAFVGTSTLMGSLYGFFYAFFTVTLYSMATYRCQRSCGIIISTLECFYGAGTISGALAGVAVSNSWNYYISFFVSGGLLLAGLPFLIFCSPGKDVEVTRNNPDQNYFRLIGSPPMVVDFLNVLLATSAIGFHDGTLEYRLEYEEAGLDPFYSFDLLSASLVESP
ncbi:uncharacterized protein LOC135387733 [Ornithodoros turicata]|uniref:uncharacterized protein LOC135387733 n=1 Tax=Ornithodoros turicata TaxID=34597 RepID=UPI0031389BA9